MFKILKNGLLGILLLGYCSTLLPMDAPAANPEKKSKIIKFENAIKATSPLLKEFVGGVLQEYGLNPTEYKMLVFNDPTVQVSAGADSLLKILIFNEANCFFNDLNFLNPAVWFSIFCCYHECGHLFDKINQKQQAVAIYPHLAAEVTRIGERTADYLACEKLLQKEWGCGPIASRLAVFKRREIINNDAVQGHDKPSVEYNNIVQFLKPYGYEVVCTQDEQQKVTVQIIKNGHILADFSVWISYPIWQKYEGKFYRA